MRVISSRNPAPAPEGPVPLGKKARVVDRNSRWVYLGRYDINLDHNYDQIQRHQFKSPPGPTSQSCGMRPYNSPLQSRFAVTQSHVLQQSAYQGGKYTRCEEEIQCMICIAVGVGANGAHQNQCRETGATNENTTAKERTKNTVRPAQLDPLPRDGT